MKKSEFNVLFRKYVKDNLSPKPEERELISYIYAAIQNVLGMDHCLQIGSYPRFTSVTPVHDLDILYVIGKRESIDPDPSLVLNQLERELNTGFVNPTEYRIEIARQTHSITLKFLKGREEIFSVDVVPAYIDGQNEYREDKYVVPEILSKTEHKERTEIYQDIAKSGGKMAWIPSDPRGYITITSEIDANNSDFRKAVKFVKKWSFLCKDMDDTFKLKSFHIERIITQYFRQNPNIEIFDAVFWFFCDLPRNLEKSWIPDRANTAVHIDAYVDDLTSVERVLMIQSRDYFLIKLEEFSVDSSVEDLLESGVHIRATNTSGRTSEEYLFDSKIATLLEDDATLSIHGKVLPREGGIGEFILDMVGVIDVDRKIDFQIVEKCPGASYKWKVKNDNHSEEPRGEINDNRTRNNPESTRYKGRHFAECYAIRNGVCVARARQDVVIGVFS